MLETELGPAAHYGPRGRFIGSITALSFFGAGVWDLQARAEDLADVEVDGAGFNLHWPKLDATSMSRLSSRAFSALAPGSRASWLASPAG